MASTGSYWLERQLALAAPDLLVGVEQDRRVERLLVAVIVVEQPLVGLGAGGDGIDARAVETLLAELVARRAEDRGLGPLRIARARRRSAQRRLVSVADRRMSLSACRRAV